MSGIICPSYQAGFASPQRGRIKHPSLWRGCVGAWSPSLGNTGLTLRDLSTYGNHGTLTNGPTWLASGGQAALRFDGSNDYNDYSTEPNIYGLAIFACSFWVYKTANTAAWVVNRYNTSAPGGTVGDYFGLAQGASIPKIHAGFVGVSIANSIDFDSGDIITLNQWHHVAISVNLTAQTATATRNGVPVTMTKTVAGTPPAVFKAKTSTPWTTSRIVGGGGSPAYSAFDADDMRLYARGLSYGDMKLLSSQRGIAYERAARRRSISIAGPTFKAAWLTSRQSQIIGGGMR